MRLPSPATVHGALRGRRPFPLLPLAGAALLLIAGCAGREGEASDRILEAASRGGAWRRLAFLCDRIGPRLSGSPGLERAVRWAEEEFRSDGLDAVWTEKVMVPRWERGREEARLVAPVEQALAATALGGSDPTLADGITAGVIEVASFEDLRRAGEKVRGRIVLYNKPMRRGGGKEHGYGAVVDLRSQGAVEAAKLGAVATLIRSLGTADYRLPHTGAMSYQDGVPRIPSAALASEDADLIHRLIAAGETVRVRLVLGCRNLPEAESANVVADLKGRERPDEIVVIGGHLDSWDLGTGAIDDGVGVAIVMETMHMLKSLGRRPRRTIRAVLFTNEENGLRGGSAYAGEHRSEIDRHIAAIEADSGGARPLGFGAQVGSGGLTTLTDIASRLARIGVHTVRGGGGGADISPLTDLGVPSLGLRQESRDYFDYHHTAADTLDKVSPEDLALNVAALAVMAYGIADLPDRLPRPRVEKREPAPTSPGARSL